MKRYMRLLCAIAVAAMVASGVCAANFKVDGICYDKNADGRSVTVTFENKKPWDPGYWSLGDNLSIPPTVTYEGVTYTVTGIGVEAFRGCDVKSVTLPNTILVIDDSAFVGCAITSIVIPNSVLSIGREAFASTNITSLTLGGSLSSIGECAFSNCSFLTSVVIPASVTEIAHSAFSVGMNSLTQIAVDEGNTIYDSRDNCNAIIETATNILLFACQNTIIPVTVTSIGDEAFTNVSLQSISIPNSVTSIGNMAFSYCDGLEEVFLPYAITSIGYWAFGECTGLTDMYCLMEDPAQVEMGDVELYDEEVFGGVPTSMTLHVPIGAGPRYRAADQWNAFNIVERSVFDLNGDWEVNVGDVNAVLDSILAGGNDTTFDVNGDSTVDVGDVNAILAEILTNS